MSRMIGHYLRWFASHGEGRCTWSRQWQKQAPGTSISRIISCCQHLPFKNERAEAQGLGQAVKCYYSNVHPTPAVLLGTVPQMETLASLLSAGHNEHSGLLPSLGSAVRYPGKPFLKSRGPRQSRKPMSEIMLGLLRPGQEWLEGRWRRQRESHEHGAKGIIPCSRDWNESQRN